jgi:Succinyl-CoA ligase like flavodoxin domain
MSARSAESCIRQRSTSQVRPGTSTALITKLSLIGQSRGRLRASSLLALAVPAPSIAVKASHTTSMRDMVSSEASHRSIACGNPASISLNCRFRVLSLGAGLPLGVGVATGNEADVTLLDVLEYLAEDEQVKVIATVFEEMRDGPGSWPCAAACVSSASRWWP